jgi:hypothetical protein
VNTVLIFRALKNSGNLSSKSDNIISQRVPLHLIIIIIVAIIIMLLFLL